MSASRQAATHRAGSAPTMGNAQTDKDLLLVASQLDDGKPESLGHVGAAVHDGGRTVEIAATTSPADRTASDPEQTALVDAIAQRVVELLQPCLASPSTPRLVDAAGLAEVLSVGVDFVYEHAAELEAIPLTEGDRPRLRFDVDRTLAALTARSVGVRSQEAVTPAAAPIRGGRPRGVTGASADLLPIRGERRAA